MTTIHVATHSYDTGPGGTLLPLPSTPPQNAVAKEHTDKDMPSLWVRVCLHYGSYLCDYTPDVGSARRTYHHLKSSTDIAQCNKYWYLQLCSITINHQCIIVTDVLSSLVGVARTKQVSYNYLMLPWKPPLGQRLRHNHCTYGILCTLQMCGGTSVSVIVTPWWAHLRKVMIQLPEHLHKHSEGFAKCKGHHITGHKLWEGLLGTWWGKGQSQDHITCWKLSPTPFKSCRKYIIFDLKLS